MLKKFFSKKLKKLFKFDVIVKSSNLDQIRELLEYVYNQNNFKNKSIYYYDILACTQNDCKRIIRSI